MEKVLHDKVIKLINKLINKLEEGSIYKFCYKRWSIFKPVYFIGICKCLKKESFLIDILSSTISPKMGEFRKSYHFDYYWAVDEGFKSITRVPDTDLPRYLFLEYVNHGSFKRELERIRNKGVI